jgi:hypothetical protein
MIDKYPDRAIGYVSISAYLVQPAYHGEFDAAKLQRAIEVLERALAFPVKDSKDYDLPSRLAEARKFLAQSSSE